MRITQVSAILLLALGLTQAVLASDLELAPESFQLNEEKAVFVDFSMVDLEIEFDVEQSQATGRATIEFSMGEAGYPVFDLDASIDSVGIDGQVLDAGAVDEIADPDNVTKLRVLKHRVDAGRHILELSYRLANGLTWEANVVRAGFFMTDLRTGGRGFWEQYGPSNLEYDHFRQMIAVKVTGTDVRHRIYTNGEVIPVDTNRWVVATPDYFSTSSLYFHLVEDERFRQARQTYRGINRDISVTVYSSQQNLVNEGMAKALSVLDELENTYGPFPHDKVLAYITPGGGGMEYCGATMTSLWALEHEFTHFWFARSVMPADGNSGWIDEAVASWRDDGYPRANTFPSLRIVNMGGFSQYRRHTSMEAYGHGAKLMSGFDHMFRDVVSGNLSGLRVILRSLFHDRRNQSLTVGYFKKYLETVLGDSLDVEFNKHVFGQGRARNSKSLGPQLISGRDLVRMGHPRPYTLDELRRFR